MNESPQDNARTETHERPAHDLAGGVLVAAAATGITLGLAALKGTVGYLWGSPALLADAVHSAADTVAILASWVGLKLAMRPPTKRFSFGLYRAETLASLVVSGVILLAGGHLLVDAVRGLAAGEPPEHRSLLVLAVALGSAGVSLVIFLWEARVGKRLQSQSLLANADESRSDILSSSAVFVGAAGTYFSVPYMERVVAVGLSGLILWLGIKHGRDALFALLDASLDKDLEAKAARVAAETPGVMRVEKVRLRRAGPMRFGIAHVGLRRSVDVTRGHEVAHEVERAVRDAIPQVEMLTVHIEPFQPERRVVAVPVDSESAEAELSEHFGRARFFAIATVEDSDMRIEGFEENTARDAPARAGLAAIKELLQARRVDAVVTREIGEIAFHTLRDHYVEVYRASRGTVEEIMSRFARHDLHPLAQPTHTSEAAGRPADVGGNGRPSSETAKEGDA